MYVKVECLSQIFSIVIFIVVPLSVRTTKTFYNTTETRTVTLNVVISGTPTNIFWFKNNDLVVTSGRFSGGTISMPALTIQNVSMSDAGQYVLEATDGTVTVKTRPIFLSPIGMLIIAMIVLRRFLCILPLFKFSNIDRKQSKAIVLVGQTTSQTNKLKSMHGLKKIRQRHGKTLNILNIHYIYFDAMIMTNDGSKSKCRHLSIICSFSSVNFTFSVIYHGWSTLKKLHISVIFFLWGGDARIYATGR